MNESKLEEMREAVAYLSKFSANQQLLLLKIQAEQEAHFASIRDMLVRSGEDAETLRQRLQSAYETALLRQQKSFAALDQTGDAAAFLSSAFGADPRNN